MKKKIIYKLLLVVAIVAIMALTVYALMAIVGVNTIDGLRAVCNNNKWITYGVIIALQIIQVIFIPLSNQLITIPAIAVIGIIPAFTCSWIGIEIGTIVLYFIGRGGGGKLLAWLLSDTEKTEKFITLAKSRKLFYPVGMLIGVIPDDLITTIAGLVRLNFWYVFVVSAVTRGICVAFTVFGFGVLTTTWWGIVLLCFGFFAIAMIGYIFLRYEPIIEERFLTPRKKVKKSVKEKIDI